MSTSFSQGTVTPFRDKLGPVKSVDLTPDKDSAAMTYEKTIEYLPEAFRYPSPATPKRSHAETVSRSPPATPKRSKLEGQRVVSSSLDTGLARLLSASGPPSNTDVTPRRQSWRRCRDYDKTPHAPTKKKRLAGPPSDGASPLKPKALFQEDSSPKRSNDITIQLISAMTALVGFLCTFVTSSLSYDGATEVNVDIFLQYLSSNSVQFRSENVTMQVLMRICELFPIFSKLIRGGTYLIIRDTEAGKVLGALRKMRASHILGSSHR